MSTHPTDASPPPPATPPASDPRAVSLRRRLLPAGLLALGVGVAVVAWLVNEKPQAGPDTAQRLAAAARQVAGRAPQAWGGLEPLSGRELAEPAFPPLQPGVPVVVAPQGLVVDGRPRTRWGGVPLTATVELKLCGIEGTPCWTRTGQGGALEFPPEERELSPGTHEMTVRLEPDGPAATRRFDVASQSQRQVLAAATAAVNAHAPKDLQALLRGHASVRLGFLLEAEACAQEALSANPKNADALALLRHVHATLGETEGWHRNR